MKKTGMIVFGILFAIGFFANTVFSADLSISNYTLVKQQRVDRTVYEYTYTAQMINSGDDAKNVRATLSSSSPYITIVDGTLTFGDILSGETVVSTDSFTIRMDRTHVFDENALIWTTETDPVSSISVSPGLPVLNIPVGSTQKMVFIVDFQTNTLGNYAVEFSQEISPNTNGISLSTDFQPGWDTQKSMTWVVNATITGNILGSYEVKTKAYIAETGQSSEATTIINVVSEVSLPELKPLRSYPNAIPISTPTDVFFSFILANSDTRPLKVSVQQTDENGVYIQEIGSLFDDGSNGDSLPNDYVYGGTFSIESEVEGNLYYRIEAFFPNIETPIYSESELYGLSVTSFPVGTRPIDMSAVVIDSETGAEILSNEILVKFVDGTTPATIRSIVESVGGTVVGTIFSLDIYQIEIPATNSDVLVKSTIEILNNLPEVDYADFNEISSPDAVTPNDTHYSLQSNLTTVRIDEAWTIARTNSDIIIAVIDTGVDYNHEDLNGRVIVKRGSDVADKDNDPMDHDHDGHGTHCAGIIAANTNNNKGIAGATWNGNILAVKMYRDGMNTYATSDSIAAIRFAVENGAKIISFSASSPGLSRAQHDAIKRAVADGVLFIAAAGNQGLSTKRYPAAFPEVLAVGNTYDNDTRRSTSNYGDWVNIAAPGVDIWSTLPGNGYGQMTGTSMSTPLVASVAALVWSKNPTWTAAQVQDRLIKTAKPLPGLGLGAGRVDALEAVFNGSFETGDLSDWQFEGNANSIDNLGPIVPVNRNGHNKKMGFVSTGPAADYASASLKIKFTIQGGITSFPLSFDYNFVTEEYPEWVNTIFNDALTIRIKKPNGETEVLATETVNGSAFSIVEGIDFPGGDETVGQTGWKSKTVNIPVTAGEGTYEIFIEDAGDDIYDSAVLIDNVRFK